MRRTAIAILCVAMAAGPVHADPEAAEPEVVPLFEGETAKFDGFLVPELRLDEYTLAEIEAKELRLRLESEEERCRKKLAVYIIKIEKATAPPAWYETPRFNFWAGVTVGILAAGAGVWGASALSK